MQFVYLPPATRVQRHGLGVDVSALRTPGVGESVHRQTYEHVEVFRVRVVRQPVVSAGSHLGDAWLSDRYAAPEGATEALEGGAETVLAPAEADHRPLDEKQQQQTSADQHHPMQQLTVAVS